MQLFTGRTNICISVFWQYPNFAPGYSLSSSMSRPDLAVDAPNLNYQIDQNIVTWVDNLHNSNDSFLRRVQISL